MVKLESNRYERGYFHKIRMKHYCVAEKYASETLSSKFISCQNLSAAKSQNFVNILWAQKGHSAAI